MKIEIEVTEATVAMLSDLIVDEDTVERVLARAAALGAAVWNTGVLAHVSDSDAPIEVVRAHSALADPEGYGE